MAYYKTEGILLRRHNLGEADRILTVLCPELGKIRVVAKGVRRGRSKLAGHLEPFVITKLQLAKGRNLDVVTSAQGQRYYRLANAELDRLALAHLLLEICDKVLTEDEPHEAAYALLNECLEALESGIDTGLIRHYFYVKLLDSLGHKPEIAIELEKPVYYLLLSSGTLQAQRPMEDSAELSADVLKLWRLVYSNSIAQVARISSAAALSRNAQPSIERFYDYQVGVRFRSELILAS